MRSDDGKTIMDAIELLQCAEVNCDNVKKVGAFFADAVKMQITDAIAILEEVAKR